MSTKRVKGNRRRAEMSTHFLLPFLVWKVQRARIWFEGYPPQLYDLLADPEEERNLAATHPDLVATLTAELHRQTGAPPDAKAASGGSGRSERDQVERLRALGYVTVDEPKAGGQDAPDAP